MKKVLIGILIGLGLIFMGAITLFKVYDVSQPMAQRVMRRRRYVKVKPEHYN